MTEQPKQSKNPFNNLSRKTLIIAGTATGVFMLLCCGSCSIFTIFANKMSQGIKTEFAEGDGLWDKGDKAGGAVKYRNIIDKDRAHFLDAADRPDFMVASSTSSSRTVAQTRGRHISTRPKRTA